MWQSYDDLSDRVYSADIVVGGILTFDVFKFPELPHKQLKWTIRSILDTEIMLNKIPYPDP